jgi:transcription antitermination factor NusG
MNPATNSSTNLWDQTSLVWYALYTKHQHERNAAKILAQKGFEALAPVYPVKHRWQDRTKEILLPVFPCYLFVRASIDRKLDILRTPGVFSMVSSAGHPCVVPAEDIQLVRRVSSNPVLMEPHAYLRSGEFVRVRVGPFAGLVGVLIRIKNLSRVVLSVELLQKSVALELDASILDPCDSPRGSAMRELTESRRIA